MVIEVFFPPPSEDDRKFSEWIKMIPLDKDAVIIQSWSGSPPTSLEDHSHSTRTRLSQSSDGVSSSGSLLGSLSTKREPPTERMEIIFGSTSSNPTYGAIASPDDLIDLESGHSRTYSIFSYPSISAIDHSPASSTETRSAGSVDTDATLVSSNTTTSIGNELLASLLATRPRSRNTSSSSYSLLPSYGHFSLSSPCLIRYLSLPRLVIIRHYRSLVSSTPPNIAQRTWFIYPRRYLEGLN